VTTPLLDIFTQGFEVPDGYDRLLLKATRPDLRTRDDYRWPIKGLVKVPKPKGGFKVNPCPEFSGDGLSLAKTAEGMAAGGYSPSTVLIVAVKNADVIAEDDIKAKVSRCFVVDIVDGLRILGTRGARADLTRANLTEADLGGANLNGAYLTRADLTEADLGGATATKYTVWPKGFNHKKARVVTR